ncbi:aminodeoxychorismate synthase component I [Longispora albida]|uniref:aminodeoxychorismate synthase component I n=1 Tax=Longispora albida TaxID=203523 RepID=UPI0003695E76|nr:aminodeoxychorismate synthase component I [Longispora albida]
MRTLLIDNYDSFTYNLFHYLAEVTGHEPVVIRNDDPAWRLGMLGEFDAVVVSPGPGTPLRDADLGLCREVLAECELPLLGVCLGHQAIAHLAGATVGHAPEPVHGRVSEVLHEGTGLFAGLPSPFEVVRYHSLTVTDLPGELEPTAWTPDGILMGLRHRSRPLWGVQFHPESICTEYGHQLLRNFTDMASPRPPIEIRPAERAQTEPREQPELRVLTVLTERIDGRWDAEAVYAEFFAGSDHAFWLDSSRSDDGIGRFSYLGDASGPLARVVTADAWLGTVTATSAGTRKESFFDWLDRDLASIAVDAPALPFDFALGWVGYLGYELKSQAGGEKAHRSADPDAAMVFADRAIVLDHAENCVYLLALSEKDDGQAKNWLSETRQRLSTVGSAPELRPVPSLVIEARHDRDTYLKHIASCHEAITDGESYEICLTNMLEADGEVEPWDAYRQLRRISPAPFGALLRFGPLAVLSTSPERFLRVHADRTVQSKPIKGTRPRGATPAEDRALIADLAANEKDRAENLMIVDLVRNDLGRCAVVGSVSVPKIFDVESYATVHQLVSTVQAKLRPESTVVGCVRAAFPGGSMTGAPKVRTMQIIDELEAGPRGVYSGALGYFSLTGAADLSMVIRTAVITPGRVSYGVGGAIVALSDPDAEFEETVVKATPVLRLLGTTFR